MPAMRTKCAVSIMVAALAIELCVTLYKICQRDE